MAPDDPAGPLINIGHYLSLDSTGVSIDELLTLLRAGRLEPGHMYTALVMSAQCDLDAARIDQVRAILRAHASDVASGNLVWATPPQIAARFHGEYREVPTILPHP